MPKYKIAEIIFNAEHHYSYTKKICADYEYFGDENPEVTLKVSKEDIEREKSLCKKVEFPDAYYESLALYRKFLDYGADNGVFVLHSSALAVDEEAFLFTAPSGTGKSTHARLYREVFLDRVTMINDDKPVIKKLGDEFYVYGTPWNGKHRIGSNKRFKVKAICQINRGKENTIEEISKKEMLFILLNQTIRPTDENKADKLFELLQQLLDSVGLYKLYCNVSTEAVMVSYEAMTGDKKNEN